MESVEQHSAYWLARVVSAFFGRPLRISSYSFTSVYEHLVTISINFPGFDTEKFLCRIKADGFASFISVIDATILYLIMMQI